VPFSVKAVTASTVPKDAKNDRFFSTGAAYLGWKYTVKGSTMPDTLTKCLYFVMCRKKENHKLSLKKNQWKVNLNDLCGEPFL
jgi:hypothetical protein